MLFFMLRKVVCAKTLEALHTKSFRGNKLEAFISINQVCPLFALLLIALVAFILLSRPLHSQIVSQP